ncbi:hypothetical protein [Spiroplasma sp. AdecLV25b]|uniref:hypothetical protein n=1 Tax=Spiroplasma sp. AdecLV25b TaxID=3027162 RepID=UPI0027E00EA0|nr:hypothetical protein [Spiroplasma sp. AdecLV25b]
MNEHVQKLIRLLIVPLYAALVFACKEALAVLPNIEVVTFLLAFAALVFPLYMAMSIPIIFGLLEVILYGGSSWVILYFSAWPILVLIVWMFRGIIKKYWWIFITITSLWGFCFGTLDSFLHLLMFGKASFYFYWIAGLPFDAVHGVGNFMFSVFLYKPVMAIWTSHLQHYLLIDNQLVILPPKPIVNKDQLIDN